MPPPFSRGWSSGYFYPRPPRGGRRRHGRTGQVCRTISIHALREEGDKQKMDGFISLFYFYPRPPRGGRQNSNLPVHRDSAFLSTPSARRATQFPRHTAGTIHISIHALREEGDSVIYLDRPRFIVFLSTPSARRATRCGPSRYPAGFRFLSTPSARRATRRCWQDRKHRQYFYPRPPRGGRPAASCSPCSASMISIHALREEGDIIAGGYGHRPKAFLSTPSARRATMKPTPTTTA